MITDPILIVGQQNDHPTCLQLLMHASESQLLDGSIRVAAERFALAEGIVHPCVLNVRDQPWIADAFDWETATNINCESGDANPKPPAPTTAQIVLIMQGGVLHEAYSNQPVQVLIVDSECEDVESTNENLITHPNDGTLVYAYVRGPKVHPDTTRIWFNATDSFRPK